MAESPAPTHGEDPCLQVHGVHGAVAPSQQKAVILLEKRRHRQEGAGLGG